jgi:alpha-1,6-mannosyltransferase
VGPEASSREDRGVPPGRLHPPPGVDPPPTPKVSLALLAGAVTLLALSGPLRSAVAPGVVPWTVATLALLHLWLRYPGWVASGGRLLGGALLLRILFLLPAGSATPDLSDDLFRYVWDGWLGVQGIPPYRFRPHDPALQALQSDPLFPALNSPGYHSVYPPLSQLVFLAGGVAHEARGWPLSGWVVRAIMTTMEWGGIVLLVAASHRAGWGARGKAALVLYAWHPLPLVTVAASGHSEGGWVLALGILALGVAGRRPALAWLGWVLAVFSKGIPILLAPLIWRITSGARQGRSGRRPARYRARTLAPAAVVGILLALPFLPPGALAGDLARAWSSARLYVELFEFNAGVHALLRTLAHHLPVGSDGGWVAPTLRGVAAGGALVIGLRVPLAPGRLPGGRLLGALARGGLLVLTLYLVTATTVHPWYLLWGLPLVALLAGAPREPGWLRPLRSAWLWVSWAAFPTYLFYLGVPALPLAVLFWGGAAVVALAAWKVGERAGGSAAPRLREHLLRPLRRRVASRKAGWLRPWVLGPRVADVGGGEGTVGVLLSPASGLLLIDPDPVALRAHPAAFPSTRVQGSAHALPLGDDSVDTVVLCLVLHHLPDPDQGLAEALRVARRRVVILESVYRTRAGRRLLPILDRWMNAGRGSGAMGRQEAPLEHRSAEGWSEAALGLGARIVHAGPPPGRFRALAPHQVLVLVLEPGGPP